MSPSASSSPTISFPEQRSVRARQRLVAAEQQIALRLRLGSTLHATLDLRELLQLVFTESSALLGTASLQYQHPEGSQHITVGSPSLHSCSYQLLGDRDELGEISFSRDVRFAENDLALLELLVSCMLLPLRNALRYQQALRRAQRDALTGVGNRAALDLALDREVQLAQRHHCPLSLVVVDIDHFKQINDRYGHLVGDDCLQAVAKNIAESCRTTDCIYRYGGEEFVLVLSQTNQEGALATAERVRQAIAELKLDCAGSVIELTASAGVAALRESESSYDLFHRADTALYRAKNAGRNRVMAAR